MRRILKETQWNVTLTTAGPPAKTLQKQIEAPSQDVAMRRAMQAFPGMQFTNVQATPLDAQSATPAQQPMQHQQALPTQPAGLRQLQGLRVPGPQQQTEAIDIRRVSYPYAITLPMHFARILKETSPVSVSEQHGQHRIVLTRESDMRGFLDRLKVHRNRDAVRAIVHGIRSSIG